MTDRGSHPYAKPEGSDAECFIQWKGTDVCMDLHCACGVSSHLDADFAYFVECCHCGRVYELGTQVILKQTDPDRAFHPRVTERD